MVNGLSEACIPRRSPGGRERRSCWCSAEGAGKSRMWSGRIALRVLQMRMSDVPAVRKVLEEPVRFVTAVEARDSVGKDAR